MPIINKNKEIGKIGEDIACRYVSGLGWKILTRNFRRKSDEIDIIGISKDGTLVFVEVKALALRYGMEKWGLRPEDNLTNEKLRKISRTCEFFARQHHEFVSEDRGWRIDLLAIDVAPDGTAKEIRHYENI